MEDKEVQIVSPVEVQKVLIHPKGTKAPNIEDWVQELDLITSYSFDKEFYEVKKINSDKVEVYLHFPEITVNNSQKNSHKVRDILIRLTFSFKSYALTMFQAARYTYTLSEYNSRYMHSHIQYTNPGNFTTSCCHGTTDISNFESQLRTYYDSDIYELFLGLIGSWLGWESLEGGPYSKIENIKINSDSRIPPENLPQSILENNLYKFLKQFDFKAKIIDKKDYEYLSLDEDYVDSLIDEISTSKCVKDPETSNFYQIPRSSNYEANKTSFNSSFKDYTFKLRDKVLFPQLINDFDTSKFLTVANPKIKQHIINTLKKIIDAKYSKGEGITIIQ